MKRILALLSKTFLIAMVLGLLTCILEWLIGWRSPTQLSNGLFIVGASLGAVGILSLLGGMPMRDDLDILWAESIGDFHVWERSQRWLVNMKQSYPRFSLLMVTGIYMVGFAILISKII
jgi:hypothetical protein